MKLKVGFLKESIKVLARMTKKKSQKLLKSRIKKGKLLLTL
jgi:hypothetical protein